MLKSKTRKGTKLRSLPHFKTGLKSGTQYNTIFADCDVKFISYLKRCAKFSTNKQMKTNYVR